MRAAQAVEPQNAWQITQQLCLRGKTFEIHRGTVET
jgi:hypothetical protein